MFNTSGMNRESPGRTGNDRQGTGKNRDCTENYRDGTLAAALPGSDAGIAPVIVGVVTVYRGSAGTVPAFTEFNFFVWMLMRTVKHGIFCTGK